jgi:hypothetical protein
MDLVASIKNVEINNLGSGKIRVAKVTFKIQSDSSSALKGMELMIPVEVSFDGDFGEATLEAVNELHALGAGLTRAADSLRKKG